MRMYVLLVVAVIMEVIATTALARADNFTRLGPSVVAALGYAAAIYLLSYPIKVFPAGVVYAIWSGFGIVLIAMVAWLVYGQKLDVPAVIGIALILAGVLVLNLFSRTVVH